MWIDSHAHLFDLNEEQLASVFLECQHHQVDTILNIGTDLKNSQHVLNQCKNSSSHVNLLGAAGISAADVESYIDESKWESDLEILLQQPDCVALGEIGIDSVNDYYAPFEIQMEFFRKQLALACRYRKPVIVHSRGVEELALKVVKESGAEQVIFHCYTGDKRTAVAIAEAGFFVSFSGIITFKKSDFDEVVKAVPVEQLLIETDSPYLAPVPNRGKQNQPAWVSFVGEYIAQILSMDKELLAHHLGNNFNRFLQVKVS